MYVLIGYYYEGTKNTEPVLKSKVVCCSKVKENLNSYINENEDSLECLFPYDIEIIKVKEI